MAADMAKAFRGTIGRTIKQSTPWGPATVSAARRWRGSSKLCLRARARCDRRVPAAQVRVIVRHLDLGPAGEVDGDHGADIGDGELRPAHERIVGEPFVEPLEEI